MERLAAQTGDVDLAIVVSPHTPGFARRGRRAHAARRWAATSAPFAAPRWASRSTTTSSSSSACSNAPAAPGAARHRAAGRRRARSRRPRAAVLPHGAAPREPLGGARLRSPHELGRLLRDTADELGRDALFVASGDMSHRLLAGAPAGYDPRGAQFDAAVVELFAARRPRRPAPARPRARAGSGGVRPALVHRAGRLPGRRLRAGARAVLRRSLRRGLRGRRFRRAGMSADTPRGRRPTARPLRRRRHEPRRGRVPAGDGTSDGVPATSPADYARRCVEALVGGRPAPPAPAEPFYGRVAACFCSLKKNGELRGCIGTLTPAWRPRSATRSPATPSRPPFATPASGRSTSPSSTPWRTRSTCSAPASPASATGSIRAATA